MGKIKEAWRKCALTFEPTRQQVELWTMADHEIEALKARVERLEQGSQPDGK